MDNEESFPLTLGAKSWELPHFTFGVIRKLQPRLLRLIRPLGGLSVTEAALYLDEKVTEEMLVLVAEAIAIVDPTVTASYLDTLYFTPSDLVRAQQAVMQACGLVRAKPSEAEGEADPKAPTSMTSSPP